MKTSLVAGGCGFLGSHLVDSLLALGHDIVVIDNLMTGKRENLKEAKAKYPNRLKILIEDIIDLQVGHELTTQVSARLYFKRFDYVFNFACPASPPAYQRDPIHTTMTCVVGTKNLLDIARHHGATFVQASTSEVYGDPEIHPQVESYRGNVNPHGVRSCYDEGKRTSESLVADYGRFYNVETKTVRIFNTYGPRMDPSDGRVVSNFIVQALRGEPLTVYGDGSQTRSICYVSDLIDGFMRVMNTPRDFTGPVNLGNPHELSVREIAKLVKDVTGSISRLIYKPLPQDDPRRRRPDISLAKSALGWEPRVEPRDGVALTAKYFRSVTL